MITGLGSGVTCSRNAEVNLSMVSQSLSWVIDRFLTSNDMVSSGKNTRTGITGSGALFVT
jgi:hypothetical protein